MDTDGKGKPKHTLDDLLGDKPVASSPYEFFKKLAGMPGITYRKVENK